VFHASCEITTPQDGVTTDGTHRDLGLAAVAERITVSLWRFLDSIDPVVKLDENVLGT
jgi:hypothetical protein